MFMVIVCWFIFLFNATAHTDIYTYRYTLSLHDALPISDQAALSGFRIPFLPACRSTHIDKPPHHVAGVNVGQRDGLRSILGKRLRTPANSARREWLGK